METMRVFNLEFNAYVKEFYICGYRFYRVDDYYEKLIKLQHKFEFIHEFRIPLNTDTHSNTALVDIPGKEQDPIFEWENKSSALQDILLLLSMFTGRNVFTVGSEYNDKDFCIIADPRVYPWGGILRASLPYVTSDCEDEDGFHYNIGFSISIEKIYSLIGSENWRNKYNNGYFLLLANNAFKERNLEAAFIQCWTIWEHLFSLHNRKWLSKKQIINMSSLEKISYLLVKYDLQNNINDISRSRIQKLSETRNKLIHYGEFPNIDNVKDNAILFIHLTEFIIAKILELTPSDIFNTTEKLEKYLKLNDDTKKYNPKGVFGNSLILEVSMEAHHFNIC